ncbi:S8 family peptidase [Bacillus cereus]|uniref:S8 family peptidase n=1 Tax=Bacillus cereus TaxID=1396 RepID=UPI0018F644E5|nr:S8 family peptidase [Bacillus cereus]MBJ7983000.1 S8 family peptidase [Bacillus cereus]
MARENNFLLGYGERLTEGVKIKRTGSDKNPPYDFNVAQAQAARWLAEAVNEFDEIPMEACPNNEVTAIVTMHPRYISKSDFPKELFEAVGVRAVGGRSKKVQPREWGIEKHPDEAITDELFVMGTKENFMKWSREIESWEANKKSSLQITHLENIKAYNAEEKLSLVSDIGEKILLEVVLHEYMNDGVLNLFEKYVQKTGSVPIMDRIRFVKNLAFVPVYASKHSLKALADFSCVRVIRKMPTIRTQNPNSSEESEYFRVDLPTSNESRSPLRVAVFDGGLPEENPLNQWVNLIEPESIGEADVFYQKHGLAVTSALLFGSLKKDQKAESPEFIVDHIRVLDKNTGEGDEGFQYYDALDRILEFLNTTEETYDFINLSIGPDIALDDGEINRWTASLDQYFAGGEVLVTVAAGNNGDEDPLTGLNRIQPPSDGVNILAVGACDTEDISGWNRANYSCIGPGRCPGIIKPDGVVFGGSDNSPFMVLANSNTPVAVGIQGTSFAAPFLLKTAVNTKLQLGEDFGPLALKALLIHRAEQSDNTVQEVGWGKFETDVNKLITCEDDEALVVFQGELLVKEHLRVPIPLPEDALQGMVTVSATLAISPQVDPAFPNAYTRGGLEVTFRPNITRFKQNEDGENLEHPETKSFFSQKNLYGGSEYELRDNGHKWEPCLKVTKRFRGATLNEPFFDVYYHNREEGTSVKEPEPIPYALVVSVKAPRVSNLYNQIARTYSHLLVPLKPQARLRINN